MTETERGLPSEYFAERGLPSEYVAERGLPSEYVAERGLPSDFFAERGLPSEYVTDRGLPAPRVSPESDPTAGYDGSGPVDGALDADADGTGGVDLDRLRRALVRTAERPVRAAPARTPVSVRRQARLDREAAVRRRRRRRRQSVYALVVVALLAAAIAVGVVVWRKKADAVADFSGPAGPPVIVHVPTGASQTDLADALTAAGVVASSSAFLSATAEDDDVHKLAAGYFELPTHLPAAQVGDALVAPAARVGRIEFRPGRTLGDVTSISGGKTTTIPGFVSQIARAVCVPLAGTVTTCPTVDQLWQQIQTADLTSVLPSWAVAGVAAAPVPRKRLEGLIYPGVYDIAPNGTAADTIRAVLGASTANWNTSDLVGNAKAAGLTPYDAVKIASIVEREAITPDMGKVARVVENRIQQQMNLQLDSTVVYALDKSAVATTKADRADPSAYNTYLHGGLPPTPIAAPGPAALAAALNPTPGDWLFFVVVSKSGTSCFSITDAEHAACVAQARKAGVFDQ